MFKKKEKMKLEDFLHERINNTFEKIEVYSYQQKSNGKFSEKEKEKIEKEARYFSASVLFIYIFQMNRLKRWGYTDQEVFAIQARALSNYLTNKFDYTYDDIENFFGGMSEYDKSYVTYPQTPHRLMSLNDFCISVCERFAVNIVGGKKNSSKEDKHDDVHKIAKEICNMISSSFYENLDRIKVL